MCDTVGSSLRDGGSIVYGFFAIGMWREVNNPTTTKERSEQLQGLLDEDAQEGWGQPLVLEDIFEWVSKRVGRDILVARTSPEP